MNKKTLIIIIGVVALVLSVVIVLTVLGNKKSAQPFKNINIVAVNQSEALSKIKMRTEVIKYQADLEKVGKKANFEIEDEGEKWLIQVFEIVQNDDSPSHTATFNWYQVDKKTGAVESEFDTEKDSSNLIDFELRNSFLAQLFEPSHNFLLKIYSFSARQPAKVASKSVPATSFVIQSHEQLNYA